MGEKSLFLRKMQILKSVFVWGFFERVSFCTQASLVLTLEPSLASNSQ